MSETASNKRSHWARLCGACTMLVLLGVPWIFSAFGVIDAAGSKNLEMLQGIFNVGLFYKFTSLAEPGVDAAGRPPLNEIKIR